MRLRGLRAHSGSEILFGRRPPFSGLAAEQGGDMRDGMRDDEVRTESATPADVPDHESLDEHMGDQGVALRFGYQKRWPTKARSSASLLTKCLAG